MTRSWASYPEKPSVLSNSQRTYLIEQAFSFSEVHDVYSDGAFCCVTHAKHEPLQGVGPVRVVADPDVKYLELSLADLLHVRTLKAAIKLDQFGASAAHFHCFAFQHQFLI